MSGFRIKVQGLEVTVNNLDDLDKVIKRYIDDKWQIKEREMVFLFHKNKMVWAAFTGPASFPILSK